MKKTLENIAALLIVAALIGNTLWFVASFFEIISKNIAPNPVYSNWNLIIKLIG